MQGISCGFSFVAPASPVLFVRSGHETDVLPATADELEVTVLLHPPLPSLEIPEANLVSRGGGERKDGVFSQAWLGVVGGGQSATT